MSTIKIGISDCSKYGNYARWIESYETPVSIIKLGHKLNNLDQIKTCHALLLTGGEDVDPSFYNRPDYREFCYEDDIDSRRDEFEWKLLEYTEANQVPVLGICRGLQFANVFFGGTLIPDIPRWGKFSHAKHKNGLDRYHTVRIDPTSSLASIIESDKGLINSNHHQSADRVGEQLITSGISEDGVVEALERKDPSSGAFLCLVQWHPERMDEQESPFVKNILAAFYQAATERSK